MSNRFDTLRDRIRRQFSRTKTYEVDLAPNETLTLLHIDDPDFVNNDEFQEHGPFNHVRVRTEAGEAEVFTRQNRETFVNAEDSGNSRNLNLNNTTGQRYIGYVRIEAGEGEAGFTAKVHVGNDVDNVELRLLEMSGLLDVSQ